MAFLPDRSEVVMRHMLQRNAEQTPDKECVLFENGEKWSYAKAVQEAYKSANVLSQIGVSRGNNVLVFMANGKGWIRTWWGINFLGAVLVPINTAYKGDILRHVCHNSQAEHIITTSDLAERLKELNLNLNILDPDLLADGSEDAPELDEPIEPWDIQAIIYTSGTTGLSKGVITTYFQTYMHAYSWRVRATENDTMLIDIPLFHSGGMVPAYALWAEGGRVAIRAVFSGSRYWDIIRETNATMAMMVGSIPAFLEKAPPRPDDANNPLRVAVATPLPGDPAAFTARFGIEDLYIVYSSTESPVPIMTQGPILNRNCCGRVSRPGIELRVVDQNDIPVPAGQVGELILRTDLPWEMNQGYWGDPEETARAWRNGWFHTGDLLYCDEEGNFYFADRKKDAIRRRGENISSFEVERDVMAYSDVVEAACVAVPSEFDEDEVKVFVVPRKNTTFNPAELVRFLIPRMPYFMVPRYIEVIDALPKTPSNKIMKYELREWGNTHATWDREAAGIKVTRHS